MSDNTPKCVVTQFTITRSKWSGRDNFPENRTSKLENTEGDMCCLGFLAKEAQPEVDRLHKSYPSSSCFDANKLGIFCGMADPQDLRDYSAINYKLARINDDRRKKQAVKEKEITDIFAAEGITVLWED